MNHGDFNFFVLNQSKTSDQQPRECILLNDLLVGVQTHSSFISPLSSVCFSFSVISTGHNMYSFFFFLVFLGPHPQHGSSQARGRVRAAAMGLHHSHSNRGSEPHLRPTPQFMATPDP